MTNCGANMVPCSHHLVPDVPDDAVEPGGLLGEGGHVPGGRLHVEERERLVRRRRGRDLVADVLVHA